MKKNTRVIVRREFEPAERRELTVAERSRLAGKVGLIAGGGRFPIYFAKSARAKGMTVVGVAVRGHADLEIAEAVDRCRWVGLAHLGAMINAFKQENVRTIVMAGKIYKTDLFRPWRWIRYAPDFRMLRAWFSRNRGDNRDDSLLLMITQEMRKDGIELASALEVCPELLVKAGMLTRRKPTKKEIDDIAFGWRMAKEMGRLDIGQTVAVRDVAVLAVEAIEGTDRAIQRAGELCPAGGFTVVKVAKPRQDMRFDVPTIGVATVETVAKAGGHVLAVEADKTILIDAQQAVARADELGLSIVSLTEADAKELTSAA